MKKSRFKLILLLQSENMLMVVSNRAKIFKSYIYFYSLTVTFYKLCSGDKKMSKEMLQKEHFR